MTEDQHHWYWRGFNDAKRQAAQDNGYKEAYFVLLEMLAKNDALRAAPQIILTMPTREWVGLTSEERRVCTQSPFTAENYRAIEAKLKEKNDRKPSTSHT